MALQQGQYKEVMVKGQGVDREVVLPYGVGSLGEEEGSEMKDGYWFLLVAIGLGLCGWVAIYVTARWMAKRRVHAAMQVLSRYHINVLPVVENGCCKDDLAVNFSDELYPDVVFCGRCYSPLPGFTCARGFREGVEIQFQRLRETHKVDTLAQSWEEIRDALRLLDDERDLWMPKQARQPPPS